MGWGGGSNERGDFESKGVTYHQEVLFLCMLVCLHHAKKKNETIMATFTPTKKIKHTMQFIHFITQFSDMHIYIHQISYQTVSAKPACQNSFLYEILCFS